jgi:GNAT superfamily N-acetyltransferase
LSSEISARRLGPDEWDLFRRLRLNALKEAPYAFGSTHENEVGMGEDWWRERLADRARFVAEADGEAAGIVSGGDSGTEGMAAVTTMWVDPRFRRRGVGDYLVKSVLGWARSSGYSRVVLWVTEGNAEAEKLYERNAFVRTGQVSLVRPGEDRIEYEMVRTL